MTLLRAVVVDDNRLNREMVARTLETRGLQTVQAENVVQGWRMIELISPHLAVIDVMLPGDLDGVDLCRMIRQNPARKEMVVVMVTASEKRRETERAMAAGADVLIPKPFSPKELWVQINTLLADRKIVTRTYKVFVLDDDETDAKLAETVLTKAGYQVMSHTQAQGVIPAIKSFSPDVVLLDVMMPALSGDILAKILRQDKTFKAKPRIVFHSNKSPHELSVLARETGAAGFVCKVDGPAALLSTMRAILETTETGDPA
ncbi:MAG TPA: response regulator [bacterium]|nr:response regulator [bacterium]